MRMNAVLIALRLMVAQSQDSATGLLTFSAKEHYPWDNPLHSELAINGARFRNCGANDSFSLRRLPKLQRSNRLGHGRA